MTARVLHRGPPCRRPLLSSTARSEDRPPAALQDWGDELFSALKAAGGRAYSNYAVGYNNVVVPAASKNGIPVGNTPGGGGAAALLLPPAHAPPCPRFDELTQAVHFD